MQYSMIECNRPWFETSQAVMNKQPLITTSLCSTGLCRALVSLGGVHIGQFFRMECYHGTQNSMYCFLLLDLLRLPSSEVSVKLQFQWFSFCVFIKHGLYQAQSKSSRRQRGLKCAIFRFEMQMCMFLSPHVLMICWICRQGNTLDQVTHIYHELAAY